jgi:hypothetical protein
MPAISADRDLLFDLLAVQHGLIDQWQLVAASQAWTRDKGMPLAEHLVDRGELDADQRAGVDAMVALHLKKHGGDASRSLTVLPAAPSIRHGLSGVAAADLAASMAVLALGEDDRKQHHTPKPILSYSRVTLTQTDADERVTLTPATEGPLDGAACRYEFLGEIARGGMGAVLKARDPGRSATWP